MLGLTGNFSSDFLFVAVGFWLSRRFFSKTRLGAI
jgi:hypothetical protein